MISKEDVISLNETGNHGSKILCFVCREPCGDSNTYYEIRMVNTKNVDERYYDIFDGPSRVRKHIILHNQCYKAFAGEELMFSDE